MCRLWCGGWTFLNRWSRTQCAPSVCIQMWFCPCPSTQMAADSPPLARIRRSEWLTRVLAPFYRCVWPWVGCSSLSVMHILFLMLILLGGVLQLYPVHHLFLHLIWIMSWNTDSIQYVDLHRNALPLVCPSDTTHPKLAPLKNPMLLPRGQHQPRVLHSHCHVSSSDSDEHKTQFTLYFILQDMVDWILWWLKCVKVWGFFFSVFFFKERERECAFILKCHV